MDLRGPHPPAAPSCLFASAPIAYIGSFTFFTRVVRVQLLIPEYFMITIRLAAHTLILLLFAGSMLHAQDVQIPIDDEGRLQRITPELEEELRLFPEFPGFVDARLFRIEGDRYRLEVEYVENGETLRHRREMSREDLRAFRETIAARLRTRAPRVLIDQDGRSAFVTGVTALSLGFYGWGIPTLLDVEDGRAAVGSYMLIGGAGFLIPYLATKNARVTDGMATLGLQGGLRGIADGLLLYWLASPSEADENALIGVAMAGSIAEMIVGYNIADNSNLSGGSAGTISIAGNFGLGIGLGSYMLIADEDFDDNRLAPALGLAMSAAGYYVGTIMANSAHYTAGDATVLATLGGLGAYAPPALLSITKSEEEKLYVGSAIAGAIGGLALGHSLLATRDFTTSQGNYISLGTSAGGLMGLGIAMLASSDDSDASLYLTLSALGAGAGFAILFSSFDEEAEAAAAGMSMNFQVSPMGVLSAVRGGTGIERQPLPLFSMQMRF